jgi:hypothetical protein
MNFVIKNVKDFKTLEKILFHLSLSMGGFSSSSHMTNSKLHINLNCSCKVNLYIKARICNFVT